MAAKTFLVLLAALILTAGVLMSVVKRAVFLEAQNQQTKFDINNLSPETRELLKRMGFTDTARDVVAEGRNIIPKLDLLVIELIDKLGYSPFGVADLREIENLKIRINHRLEVIASGIHGDRQGIRSALINLSRSNEELFDLVGRLEKVLERFSRFSQKFKEGDDTFALTNRIIDEAYRELNQLEEAEVALRLPLPRQRVAALQKIFEKPESPADKVPRPSLPSDIAKARTRCSNDINRAKAALKKLYVEMNLPKEDLDEILRFAEELAGPRASADITGIKKAADFLDEEVAIARLARTHFIDGLQGLEEVRKVVKSAVEEIEKKLGRTLTLGERRELINDWLVGTGYWSRTKQGSAFIKGNSRIPFPPADSPKANGLKQSFPGEFIKFANSKIFKIVGFSAVVLFVQAIAGELEKRAEAGEIWAEGLLNSVNKIRGEVEKLKIQFEAGEIGASEVTKRLADLEGELEKENRIIEELKRGGEDYNDNR